MSEKQLSRPHSKLYGVRRLLFINAIQALVAYGFALRNSDFLNVRVSPKGRPAGLVRKGP